jgi:ribosomal protein RSM22 (predicted rRNA methylase)
MPATYAAMAAVMQQTARMLSPGTIRSLVDLGSGAGAALWAAAGAWPALDAATLIDGDAGMLALGARLWCHHPRSASIRVDARRGRLDGRIELPPADVVTLSYLLGELEPSHARAVVMRAFEAARVAVLVVEPGTPRGHRSVLDARAALLEGGGHIVAPCPHGGPCPLVGEDWCHFAVRLARSRAHRHVKHAELAWEDEKYSCVVAGRAPVEPSRPRILRHPLVEKGRVVLKLCTSDGIAETAVTRRDAAAWRAARHARWGDVWPPVEKPAEMP